MLKKLTLILVTVLMGVILMATLLLAQEVYLVGAARQGCSNYILCNMDGTFGNQQYMGQVPQPYYSFGNGIGDFDNDGDYDYIIGTGFRNEYMHHIYLYEKLGDGNTFAAPVSVDTWFVGNWPNDMAVADYNNDGNMDFILTQSSSYDCELYLGNGDLTFTRSIVYETAPFLSVGADATDFNNDGNADFVISQHGEWNPASSENMVLDTVSVSPYLDNTYYIHVNLGNGDGTFTPTSFIFNGSSSGVTAGDFDNDGNKDIIVDCRHEWNYYLYKGNGDGTFQPGTIVSGMVHPGMLSPMDNFDLDKDGDLDIVIGGRYSVDYYSGNGDGTFTHVTKITGGTGSYRSSLSAPPAVMSGSPVADAEPDSQIISPGGTAYFDGSNSYDTDGGTITSYEWDFGDGNTDTGITTSHPYPAEGIFTVYLKVTDNDDKIVNDFVIVKVLGSPPIADLNGPYAGTQYVPIAFDGSSSSDDYGITGYEWDFEDGSTESEITPLHTYTISGTFTVTLTVSDAAGQTSTKSTTVNISEGATIISSMCGHNKSRQGLCLFW